MANFLLPMIRGAADAYQLRNVRNAHLLAQTVMPAFEPATRRRGLLGRDSLGEGSALVLAPTNAIHTCGMRFAIDVVFVRRNGVVVKVRSSVPPWRALVSLPAYAVIELPSGTLGPDDVRVGDVLAVTPVGASGVEVPPLARVS